jgi:hypothetical protein
MVDPCKGLWPKSEDDFRKLFETIEAELQAEKNPFPDCVTPSNSEFDEEFFMIRSWIDHVTGLE